MAQKTYLQLVNEAMAESKVSVDQLTSVDFDAVSQELLHDRFKAWVNQAYEELLMERPEWLFRNERTMVSLRPRLHLRGMADQFNVGDVMEGQSSGTIFTIYAKHLTEEAEHNDEPEFTVSVEFAADSSPQNIILREEFHRISPTTSEWTTYFIGPGRYDLSDLVVGLDSIDEDSVHVHRTVGNAVTHGDTWRQGRKVDVMDWAQWAEEYDLTGWGNGEFPRFMTRTPSGLYALYPMPDSEVLVTFNYVQKVELLSAHDDVPLFPEQYHAYIMWKTVEKFADWDRQGALFMRAQKNAEKYRTWMERDLMPKVGFMGWNGVKIGG